MSSNKYDDIFNQVSSGVVPPSSGKYDDAFAASMKSANVGEPPVSSKTTDSPAPSSLIDWSGLKNRLASFAGGYNELPARALGVPMDTLANAADIVKSGLGVGYHELTGNQIPNALELTNRAEIPGTSDWLLSKARQVPGVSGNIIDTPQQQEYPGFAAAGRAAGMSMLGSPSALAALGAGSIGALSGAIGEKASEMTNPQVGLLASLAPYLLARGAPAAYNAALDTISGGKATPIEQASLAGGNRIGLVVSPSSANRSTISETLAGTPQVREGASLRNEAAINDVAAQYLGLPAKTSLTPQTLDNVLSNALDKYAPIKKLPAMATDDQYLTDLHKIDANFGGSQIAGSNSRVNALIDRALVPSLTGEQALKNIQELRFNSNKNYRSDDPAVVNEARAQRAVADALEGVIERQGNGPPSVMKDYRDARQQIARLNTIQDAINPGTGNVNIQKIANSGAPLTGDMAAAAQFARAFPRDVRPDMSTGPLLSQMGQYGAVAGGAFGSPARGALMTAMLAAKRKLGVPMALGQGSQNALLGRDTPVNPMLLSQPAMLSGSNILSSDYLNGQ